MYVLVILSNVPCHDPCPEFLQPAVTLPWIVFKMETKMQALIKNGTKIKLRDFLIDPVAMREKTEHEKHFTDSSEHSIINETSLLRCVS